MRITTLIQTPSKSNDHHSSAVTEADFQFVERQLNIRLPDDYRKVMCPFPIRAYVGNSDTDFWDDSAGLVELNRKLRSEPGWRSSLFAVGERDALKTVIDLSTPNLEVWRIFGSVQGAGSGPTNQSFADWSDESLKQMRSCKYMDGFDPVNDPPGTRTQTEPTTVWTVLRCVGAIVGIAAVIALIIFCIQMLFGWV